MGPARPRGAVAAAWTCGLVTLAVVSALSWPLPLHLGSWHLLTPFGDSHAWVFDWLARHLGEGPPATTAEAGYPVARAIRVIGWGPALLFVPLRAVMSPLAAANLLQLLSLPASAVAAYGLLRRFTAADPWTAAALGCCYGLGPTLLSTFGIGELPNAQAWVFPLALWVVDRALADLRWAPVAAGVALLTAFTSPYFGLALPFLVVGQAGFAALSGPGAPPARLLRPAAAVLAVALGLLPARGYYAPHETGGGASVFRPALQATAGATLGQPSPVATLDALLAGRPRPSRGPYDPQHVAGLGVALLAAAALSARRGQRGAAAGLALALGGALLALGPYLAWDDDYLRVGGRSLLMPVWALEQLGYPTRSGGMYFRYAILAELGLVLLVSAGLAGRRRGALLAWLLLALHLADSLRSSGPMWPRPSEAVPDQAALSALRGEDGAVLELPVQGPTDGALGQPALLRALFHGRPTSALPRDVRPRENPVTGLLARVEQHPEEAADALRGAGFRYVMLPAEHARRLRGDAAALVAALGPPDHDGAVRWWDLGPTALAPQSVDWFGAPGQTRPPRRARDRDQ